jgi:beta-glucosidase
MPNEWLVGFQRITLNAGETKPVTIPVKAQQLRRWDETKKAYVVDPGVYDLRIGSTSDHLPLTKQLEITQ